MDPFCIGSLSQLSEGKGGVQVATSSPGWHIETNEQAPLTPTANPPNLYVFGLWEATAPLRCPILMNNFK